MQMAFVDGSVEVMLVTTYDSVFARYIIVLSLCLGVIMTAINVAFWAALEFRASRFLVLILFLQILAILIWQTSRCTCTDTISCYYPEVPPQQSHRSGRWQLLECTRRCNSPPALKC